MINKNDHIIRLACSDMTLTQLITLAVTDNFDRIPFTNKGGYIDTAFGEEDDEEHTIITVCGFMNEAGIMMQQITVIYFDTIQKANRFLSSTEGRLFDDTYSSGQDCFDYTTFAGNPNLPFLIATILKNHFGFKDNSRLCAHTHCEVDYFRKDPDNSPSICS